MPTTVMPPIPVGESTTNYAASDASGSDDRVAAFLRIRLRARRWAATRLAETEGGSSRTPASLLCDRRAPFSSHACARPADTERPAIDRTGRTPRLHR